MNGMKNPLMLPMNLRASFICCKKGCQFEQKNYTSKSVKGRELETKEKIFIRCSVQLGNIVEYIEKQRSS